MKTKRVQKKQKQLIPVKLHVALKHVRICKNGLKWQTCVSQPAGRLPRALAAASTSRPGWSPPTDQVGWLGPEGRGTSRTESGQVLPRCPLESLVWGPSIKSQPGGGPLGGDQPHRASDGAAWRPQLHNLRKMWPRQPETQWLLQDTRPRTWDTPRRPHAPGDSRSGVRLREMRHRWHVACPQKRAVGPAGQLCCQTP